MRARQSQVMKEDWRLKYRAAILERNPVLQSLRIAEAYEAIMRRLEELEENSNDRHKLEAAIDTLNRLRDRNLDRSA